MTRRTDHIRATALNLARANELTARALADAIYTTEGQARRWIRRLRDERLIEPCNKIAHGHTGPPLQTWRNITRRS